MIYAVAVIDRLNLGSAYTAGMGVDLVRLWASYWSQADTIWHRASHKEDVSIWLSASSSFRIHSCEPTWFLTHSSLTPATSQLPGNLILRKFGVRNWLTFIVIGWGAVQLGMGFVNVWPWLVFCRFFLGAFEVWQLFPFQQRSSPDKIQASIFSSILFVMTTWYATEPLSYQYL